MMIDGGNNGGFFSRLKSMFSKPQELEEIQLTEKLNLCNKSIRIPLSNCPIKISLGSRKHVLLLVVEPFIGEASGEDGSSLILFNPDRYYSRITGFIRLATGQSVVIGRGEEQQQEVFEFSDKVARRHLFITHEGDTLMLKDLMGEPGTTLAPAGDDNLAISEARMDSLREMRRIYGGPIRLLSPEEALQDLKKVNSILKKEPLRPKDKDGMPGGVVKLPKNMIPIIIGDLHAQVDNLLTLLTQNKFLEMLGDGKAAVVFLGDAVHSEMDGRMAEMDSSLLIMDIILRLKLWFPQQVFYVRGNHDSFSDEVAKCGVPQGILWSKAVVDARGKAYKKAMDKFYELLPYIALSRNYVACHAAPPKAKVDMDMLVNIRKFPGLIEELINNRLYRPNRLAGYTKGDVKRFRKALKLRENAELFVGHTPLTRSDTLWLDVGGIEHHDVVFSGNIPWVGVFTRVNDQMIPLRYRSESLLDLLNSQNDVEIYNELEE